MSTLILLVPLVLFALMAIALVVAVRRTARVLAVSRERDAYRATILDLGRRIDQSLAGVADRIDAVRRHQVDPESIDDSVKAASEAVEKYADEAKALKAPTVAFDVKDSIVSELERAGRALDMTAYGCEILSSVAGRHRYQEAQTAIKRGYLNVLHSRDAIGQTIADLDRALRRASAPRRAAGAGGRRSAA